MQEGRLEVKFARRVTSRVIRPYSTQPSKLSPILAIRKLEDRKKFQYRIEFEDGTTKDFLNFKQLQWFIDTSLRYKNKHIILTRSDNVKETKNLSC